MRPIYRGRTLAASLLRWAPIALDETKAVLTIGGVDRTLYYDRHQIEILDDLNELPNTLSFECFGFTPANYQVVSLLVGTTKEFEGRITAIAEYHDRVNNRTVYRVTCIDYTYDLDALLVTKAYGSQSGTTTAADIITNFTSGFTQVHIAASLPTVAAIQFKMTRPSSALRQLCDAIGGDCYVDYDKDVHVFLTETDVAPDTLSTSTTNWWGFKYRAQIEKVVNRIFVEGLGTNVTLAAAVGATTLRIEDYSIFSTSGGLATHGNQVISYTGLALTDNVNAWAAQQPTSTVYGWVDVAWAPSLAIFVAVSSGGQIVTSPDGITWTSRTAPATVSNLAGVCWSSTLSLFVAVSGSGTDLVATSPDGITWTARTAATANPWEAVVWAPALGLFVAVALSGTNRVMTSPNGTTWTARSADTGNWIHLAWAPALSLLVAVGGSGAVNHISTSPDGITWTARTPAAGLSLSGVAWSPPLGLFAAVGGTINTSPDGITWTSRTVPGSNSWSHICWSPELALFVAVAGSGTNRVMTSADGINWTARTTVDGRVWVRVAWSPELGMFVAVGSAGSLMTSMAGRALSGIPSSSTGSIVNAIAVGDEINLLVQRDDATSQATYGIRQYYVQDRRLSTAGAQARGDAELTLRKDPYIEGSYITTDTKPRSGRRVPISMATWGISATYTITRVRVHFDPDHKVPVREVTFSSNAGANDLYRLLRRIQEQQQVAA